MKKTYKKLVAVLASAVCIAIVGTTWAYYTNSITITNPFSTPKSSSVLIENFDPNSTFLPGETVEKAPFFQNTGEVDMVLRLKVEKEWRDEKGSKVSNGGINDPDVDAVEVFTTESWKEDWTQIGDYYYYEKIFKAGEPTPEIMTGLKLLPTYEDTENGKLLVTNHPEVDYSNLVFVLDFNAEAIPADTLSVAGGWGLLTDSDSKTVLLTDASWQEVLEDNGNASN